MLSLIAVAIVVSMVGVIVSSFVMRRGPGVPSETALVLKGTTELAEIEGAGLLDQFIEGPPTVRAVVDALRAAKTDRRVRALIVRPNGSSPFWAKTQEVRDAILDFKTSGKKTIAFLEFGGDQDYYLATACDRIVLLPTSGLDLKGLATYEVFLRGSFDKIGAVPDLLHIGDYKTAINTFTEKTFTPAHREMTESLNADSLDQIVQGIAAARKKTPDEIRLLLDQGPFLPEDALRTGLVDELGLPRRGGRERRARTKWSRPTWTTTSARGRRASRFVAPPASRYLRGRHDRVGQQQRRRRQLRRVGHARGVHRRSGRR